MKHLLTLAFASFLFSCNNVATERKEYNVKDKENTSSSGTTIYSGGDILTMEGDQPN